MAGFKETIVTRRNTDQQRARELQRAEGIGYHEALNRVREGKQPEPAEPETSPVVLTDSTLIVIESAANMRCNACFNPVDREWALYLMDARAAYDGTFMLCCSCAKAIGDAVAHIPAPPVPDRESHVIPLPAASAPDQVVAYLSPDRVHLLCRGHIPTAPSDYLPVTARELEALGRGFRPGGGGRHCSVCDLDVLSR
jgi:hypothetical protein